jgi:phosphatidylserine decarboxylase
VIRGEFETIGVWLLEISSVLFLAMTIFFMVFFRDPDRTPPGNGITAPADGLIKSVTTEKYDGKKYYRIVTFMNIHNVHVNRIPLDGVVVEIERKKGGYLPAYKSESSRNNQVKTVLKTKIGMVTIVQIVGIFARRIVVYSTEGEKVIKGDRLGIIRFGSRVDLILPENKVSVKVKVGDKVLANVTTLAEKLL